MFCYVRQRSSIVITICLSFLMVGCEKEKKDETPKVSLKGKLVEKGSPWGFEESKIKYPKGVSAPPGLTAGGASPLQVIFFSDTPGIEAVNAQVNADAGTFEVPAIKPGKYRIAIFLSFSAAGIVDPLGGKFTIASTKIVREIVGGEDLELDITKPQG